MASIQQRTSSDGHVVFRVQIRLRGYPAQSASFGRLTDARRWVQSTESAIREGRHFKTAEAKRHTLADLIDRYCVEVLDRKPKNTASARLHLTWWKSCLGVYALADLGSAQVVDGRNALLNDTKPNGLRRSNATVVRYLASLSHAFTIAVMDWGWVENNPVLKVTKPKEPRGRERFLSDGERDRLLAACRNSSSQYLYTVVVVALSTGMRRGEIMTLRWPQIQLPRRLVILTDTKNGTSRGVPLTGLALELIANLGRVRRIDTDLVFVGEDRTKPIGLTKAWMTAVRKAELTDFRFHDLRHSAASYLAMNGATSIEIAAVLGHKTLQMVKRYSHLGNAHTQAVVSAMNEKMFGAIHHGS